MTGRTQPQPPLTNILDFSKYERTVPKYDWDADEPPPPTGLGTFWFGVVVGAMIEAGLILIISFILWVL